NRADRAFAKIEDFVTRGRTLAGDGVRLVITIQMVFVSPVTEFHTLEQLVNDVRVAGSGEERGEPVQPGEDAVLDGVGRDVAGPSGDAGCAEAAFHHRRFALR